MRSEAAWAIRLQHGIARRRIARRAEWTTICSHRPQALGRRLFRSRATLGSRTGGRYNCTVRDGL
jgi:hypothetical protein